MSVEGPVVETTPVVEVLKPTKEEIRAANKKSMEEFQALVLAKDNEDPFAQMGVHEYRDKFSQELEKWPEVDPQHDEKVKSKTIKRKEFDEVESKLMEEFRALCITQPVSPTAPTKPEVPSLGLMGLVGYAKHDEKTQGELSEYSKKEAVFQAQKKEFESREKGNQGFKQGLEGAKKVVLAREQSILNNQHLAAYNGRPSPLDVKKATGLRTPDTLAEGKEFKMVVTVAEDEAPDQWKAKEGLVSKFERSPSQFGPKHKLTHAYDLRKLQFAQAKLPQVNKEVNFQPDPRTEAKEMKEAKEKAAKSKVKVGM